MGRLLFRGRFARDDHGKNAGRAGGSGGNGSRSLDSGLYRRKEAGFGCCGPGLGDDVDKEEEIIAVLKIAIGCTQSNPERRPSMRHLPKEFIPNLGVHQVMFIIDVFKVASCYHALNATLKAVSDIAFKLTK
ncbi:hypothetical protein OSB04_018334 [Centaurea solstitialis]|uniref:Uncharacterized protein n=1 Tax=Centaurea solstitialis TaxID=347529 RepID=A0AA38T6B7_9ASTR|nr:hypothetical protein OSB04_018334 [Centaurea solstitialis]